MGRKEWLTRRNNNQLAVNSPATKEAKDNGEYLQTIGRKI